MLTSTTETSARILVVDDEPYVREILSRWLTAAGYECAQCSSGRALQENLREYDTHLVTLDVNLPGERGIDLLPMIKDVSPDTQVLMVTAIGEAQTAIDALTQGACGYIVKPVEKDELLMRVRCGLEQRDLRMQRKCYTRELEEQVERQTHALRRAHEETIRRLVSAASYRDEETGAHVRRVGLFSGVIARAAGWPDEFVERIRMAAPMHDVGKIGIPDAILRKPGKLTTDEYEIMKSHTLLGAAVLAESDSPMLQMAHDIALSHHEKWDGRGYPLNLAGTAIPESARIVAIVDVYDALTHDRVYRPALDEEEGLEIMRAGRGTHFDADLLDVFMNSLSEIRYIARCHPDSRYREEELEEFQRGFRLPAAEVPIV